MSDYEVSEALEELGIPETATPDRKLRAACQWYLGDPAWARAIKLWMRECGFRVVDSEDDLSVTTDAALSDKSEWIYVGWNDRRPVNAHTYVDVTLRNGYCREKVEAGSLRWTDLNQNADIVRYRISQRQ